MPELDESQFATLQAAVTAAKDGSLQTRREIEEYLRKMGHPDPDVKAALDFWGAHEANKTRKRSGLNHNRSPLTPS